MSLFQKSMYAQSCMYTWLAVSKDPKATFEQKMASWCAYSAAQEAVKEEIVRTRQSGSR